MYAAKFAEPDVWFLVDPVVFHHPPAGAFNPFAQGEYSFALIASRDGVEVARSAINVDVGAVPEPAPLALSGLAVLGMAGARKLRCVSAANKPKGRRAPVQGFS